MDERKEGGKEVREEEKKGHEDGMNEEMKTGDKGTGGNGRVKEMKRVRVERRVTCAKGGVGAYERGVGEVKEVQALSSIFVKAKEALLGGGALWQLVAGLPGRLEGKFVVDEERNCEGRTW